MLAVLYPIPVMVFWALRYHRIKLGDKVMEMHRRYAPYNTALGLLDNLN